MSANRSNIHWHLNNMIAAPAGIAAVKVIYKSEDGILLCYGTTVPDALAGYAQGCIFMDINGSAGATVFVNEGDDTTSDFNAVGAEDSLAALLLTGTSFKEALQSQTKGVEAAYPHSTLLNTPGPSPLVWDGAPIEEVKADPTKGLFYFDDFNIPDVYTTTVLNNGILFTQNSGAGTVANDPTKNCGVLLLTAPAVADDGPTVQWPGLQVTPLANTKIYLEFRLKISTDAEDIFIGLCDDAVTSVANAGTIITNKDHAGFFRDDGVGSAAMGLQSGDGSTVDTADDSIADVDKTKYENFAIVIDGVTSVKFYHKGALIKTITDLADVPDAIVCPVVEITTDVGGVGGYIAIDWIQMLVYDADGSCRES